MLKIYHAPNTRSLRLIWLCEELGIPYDLQTLKFTAEDLQSEKYLALHPLGKVPSIDEDGLVLNESGAIAQYLMAKHGKGRLEPEPGTAEYGKYLQWFHFAEATFMVPLGNIAQHTFVRPEDQRIPQVAAESVESAKKILGILDKELAGKDFICGKALTAADIMLGYDLFLCKMFGLLSDDYPNVGSYFNRLASRDAFKKATA
ncbi:glutathione S-transferase family protein [Parvibaculum sp.]|jgi:glutathione S-transferase|uniref:glutathione S-transferase family protein n=1 Tax=Parvibaculum sp. TaxID=2024848 RepID=UPI000C4C478C|nr:glutathione S-transferase family protein [Parvibaculum sp.]MAM94778.1 glutathione S-transferase [Parvibaculum sp.]HCX66599.1 glutathione S-transferase [Rhodobiaceae bacterium]|tara:strand:- start:55115 stop:55723 length:609 start_codon:yes stop_codon:yes gene_type:complete